MSPTAKLAFDQHTPTPEGTGLHGKAAASGLVTAGVNFHRGFDASTTLDLEARIGAELVEIIRASLEGGVSIRGAGQLVAGFPLDLFSDPGGGLLARLRLQIEAAAFLRASVAMTGEAFGAKLTERLQPPLRQLLDVLIEETAFEAGVWAHAGFTAQLVGEFALTGQLLPPDDCGITFQFQIAAGWYFGYGVNFTANLTFPDIRHLLARLSDVTSGIVLGAVDDHLARLPADQRGPLLEALPYLHIVVPVATRTLFQAGAELGTAAVTERGQAATRAAVQALFSSAQETALTGLFDAGMKRLIDVVGGPVLVGQMLTMDSAARTQVTADLRALADALDALRKLTPTQPDKWVAAVLGCLAPVRSLLERGVVPSDVEGVLGTIWSAAQLLRHAVAWIGGDDSQPAVLTGTHPVGAAANDPTASWVADHTGAAGPGALVLGDLVTLLTTGLRDALEIDPLDWIRETQPSVAEALDWVGNLLGMDPLTLIGEILTGLGARTDAELAAVLRDLTAALTHVVDTQLVPHLITPLRDGASAELADFIDNVLTPTIRAVSAVILPRLIDVHGSHDSGPSDRLAEAISGLLLQQLSHISIHGIDILLDTALSQAAPDMLRAADAIEDAGRKSPEFSAIAATAAALLIGIDVLPGDIADLLRLSSRAMTLWNDEQRRQLLEVARLAVSLDLHAGGLEDLTTILDSSVDPPNMLTLETALNRVVDGAAQMVTDDELLQGMLLMPVHHAQHQVELLVSLLAPAVHEAIRLVNEGLQLVTKLANAIDTLVKELPGYAATVTAQIGAFAAQARSLVGTCVTAVHDAGLEIFDPILEAALAPLPDFVRDPARDAAHDLYEQLFTDVRGALDAPLAVLEKVADWATVALEAQARYGSASTAALSDSVRASIYRAETTDLNFVLGIPVAPPFVAIPVTVTVPGTDVLRMVANTLLSDATVQDHLDAAVTAARQRVVKQKQHDSLVAVRDAGWDQATTDKAREVLTAVPSLAVHVMEPADSSFHRGPATVKVRVDGARRVDLEEDEVLKVPRRIRVSVNDRDLVLPSTWHFDDTGATCEFYLRVPRNALPAGPNAWIEQAAVDPSRNPFWFRRPPTVIGRAGINTVAVFAVGNTSTTPAKSVVVRCCLNPPRRNDLLLYDAVSGTGQMLSMALGLGVDVTTEDTARDWTAIIAGEFGAADTVFYAAPVGRLSWCDVGGDGVIRSLGSSVVTPGATVVVAGDFGGDARDEVLLYNPTTGAAHVVATNGDGTVSGTYRHDELGPGWTQMAAVPLPGSGDDHLLTYRATDGTLQEWELNIPPGLPPGSQLVFATTGAPVNIGVGWDGLTPGYFDGSGNPGVYATSLSQGQFWVRGPGATWQAPGGPTPPGDSAATRLQAAGDFTYEGAGDLVMTYLTPRPGQTLPGNATNWTVFGYPKPDGDLELYPGTSPGGPWPGPVLTHLLSGKFAPDPAPPPRPAPRPAVTAVATNTDMATALARATPAPATRRPTRRR